MTASALIARLQAKGITIMADSDKVKLFADPGVITDADRDDVRAIKADVLSQLTRPALGTFRRPQTVRGSRLGDCPFSKCDGKVSQVRHLNIYHCADCDTYFELVPHELIGE